MAISLALDYGVNGGSAAQRYMSNATGSTLAYQLFRMLTALPFGDWRSSLQRRLIPQHDTNLYGLWPPFATNGFPAQGSYTDTVTVTLTY